MLRNFAISFGTTGYRIDKNFTNPLTCFVVFGEMLSLVFNQ